MDLRGFWLRAGFQQREGPLLERRWLGEDIELGALAAREANAVLRQGAQVVQQRLKTLDSDAGLGAFLCPSGRRAKDDFAAMAGADWSGNGFLAASGGE